MTRTIAEIDFIAALTALSKRYGVIIDGCGCCGSPGITTAKPHDKIDAPGSQYALDSGASSEVKWIPEE